jgi:hypothetical protein
MIIITCILHLRWSSRFFSFCHRISWGPHALRKSQLRPVSEIATKTSSGCVKPGRSPAPYICFLGNPNLPRNALSFAKESLTAGIPVDLKCLSSSAYWLSPGSWSTTHIHINHLEPQSCSNCLSPLRKLSTFGFWGQKLSPETTKTYKNYRLWWSTQLMVKIWKLSNISQHPKVPLLAAHWASGERGYARRIQKNTALFHLFFTFFQCSVLTQINRQPISGWKATRDSGKMAHNTQHYGIVGYVREQRKSTFWAKQVKTIDFRWMTLF